MKSLYVYHVDDEIVHDVINGVLYSVPPGEPYEFVDPFIGRKFMEHKWFHGVVEVELERTRAGWMFKLEEAHAKALESLQKADDAYGQAYIETQHQDRLAASRPALPPSVRQKKILARQSVNLEDFGIVPIGAKSSQEKMFAAMIEQNAQMMQMIAAMATGGQITPAMAAKAGRPIHEPEHVEEGSGRRVLVPPTPPRNMVAPASAVVERPEPRHAETRFYSEGEDPETDPSKLGPEFAGNVDDPNEVPGPKVMVSPNAIDLSQEAVAGAPLADVVNMEEDRVTIKVPGIDQVKRVAASQRPSSSKTQAKTHQAKTKVSL